MRKWIIRVLALFLCVLVTMGWIFYVWLWPSIQYGRVHHAIHETTSVAKLRSLARQAATVADILAPTHELLFVRGNGDIPRWVADLDPGWVAIDRDQVMVELCGGFDHYGFVFRRSESNPNEWAIFRYDESREMQVGTYQHSGAASFNNSLKPTSALSGSCGSP